MCKTIKTNNNKKMDTNLKNAIAALREEIAALEKEQKAIKPQRKTVHFTGERTMTPLNAHLTVMSNKYDLRLMYAAYNLLRGKNFDITESNAKPLIYDRGMYYAYPKGIHGQYYTLDERCNGKHPLCDYLYEINQILDKYGYNLKNYEEKEDPWGYKVKKPSVEKYEEIVCVGE